MHLSLKILESKLKICNPSITLNKAKMQKAETIKIKSIWCVVFSFH